MKKIEDIGAQGDVLFRRVEKLPRGLLRETDLVVAHSETGHHHRAKSQRGYELERYTDPAVPLVSYLRIRRTGESIHAQADRALAAIEAVLVEHERSFDTHETVGLVVRPAEDEAVYQVVRQRQLTPEGWARAVID